MQIFKTTKFPYSLIIITYSAYLDVLRSIHHIGPVDTALQEPEIVLGPENVCALLFLELDGEHVGVGVARLVRRLVPAEFRAGLVGPRTHAHARVGRPFVIL